MTRHDKPSIWETKYEAAARTKLSLSTIDRLISQGVLQTYRVGSSVRLRPKDVDDLFTPDGDAG